MTKDRLDKVSTVLRVPANPKTVWNRMMTYEEIPTRPPFLLRLFLPVPIATRGDKSVVGVDIFCEYRGGHLVKQTTLAEPFHLLRFKVTEQHLGIEKQVRAVEGSYEISPAGDETDIKLTTVYRGFMGPRFFWRGIESIMLHTLHRHILVGMRVAIATPAPVPPVAEQEPICPSTASIFPH